MTVKQALTIEQALARAAKEGIEIIGRGTLKATGLKFWAVSSSNYATTGRAYIVTSDGERLHCNCQTRASKNNPDGICKHRAVIYQALKERETQQAEAERLVELPRELANVETSEETKLAQMTSTPVCGHCQCAFEPGESRLYCDECLGEASKWDKALYRRWTQESVGPQLSVAARAERAILDNPGSRAFSIFASE